MPTELISATKPVLTKKAKREMVIVTTESGATVWVPKSQFDPSAERISYELRKKGSPYKTSDGAEGILSEDRNEFLGSSKQIVRQYSKIEILEHLHNRGIMPTLAI